MIVGDQMQRSYYAIIPANVRYDKNLPANAKLLYGEITALCNERGYCWATNNYFAELYGVSKVSISKWINKLVEQGYIGSSLHYKVGSKEIEGRYLTLVNDPHKEKFNTPIKEKFKENTTSINTTVNNTNNKNHMSGKPDSIPYSDIIKHLNEKANRSFKVTNKWKDLIKARWNEGQRYDDFIKVIDVKTAQWLKDSKMSKYLRPETLFSNKFDSYLNEIEPIKNERTSNSPVVF